MGTIVLFVGGLGDGRSLPIYGDPGLDQRLDTDWYVYDKDFEVYVYADVPRED